MKHLAIIGAALLFATGTAQAQGYERAVRNYQAVISGQRKLADLTQQEQAEVLAVGHASYQVAFKGIINPWESTGSM